MEKIFVQIASYRDAECQWTVKDLFEKAAFPQRLFVGICLQYDETEDTDLAVEPYPFPAQVRILTYHPRESLGSGWAHAQAQSLWDGEDYVLQIHAHMRFEQGWDETLIDMLARCPSAKPALATCLPGYVPPGNLVFRDSARASFVFVANAQGKEPAFLKLQGALVDKNEPMECPTHTPFWVGNFLFARAIMLQDVPFDPHIYYYGEALAYSARLFTHGYDLFEPDHLALYHWWGRDFKLPRPYREIGGERQKHTYMRIAHLLRLQASPASAALTELEHYGLGTARSIGEFWQFCGIDLHANTHDALAAKGRWNEAFVRYRNAQAEEKPAPPRIFVQIASYRDPECQWTVKDLFEKAKYPDRVFVGICWQHDPDQDQDYFRISIRPDQVRTALFHWKESQGVCWARHQTQQLWQGEEYTLMIDSHMRMEFDWDESLIADLALCDSPKPVLSNYPAAYTPPHNLEKHVTPTVQRPHPYEDGDIRFRGDHLDRLPEKPLRGAFIAAGLFFARSEVIREVPYDPYLYFNQEELSLAIRLFTHGWDVYHMRRVLVYHLYVVSHGDNKRPLHWQDNPKWVEIQQRGRKRMDAMMGFMQSDDPAVTRDLSKYGLGSERTLEEFSRFCGIDFKTRTISDWALRCGFIKDLHLYKDAPIYIPEIDAAHTPQPAKANARVLSFPDPLLQLEQPFNRMLLTDGSIRSLEQLQGAPEGVLILGRYLELGLAEKLLQQARSCSLSAIPGFLLSVFTDIVCHRIAPFYNTDIEWFEPPIPVEVPHAANAQPRCDAEAWQTAEKQWRRVHERDYTAMLFLDGHPANGVLRFIDSHYRLETSAGMLVAFPSDHRYLYQLESATSGVPLLAAYAKNANPAPLDAAAMPLRIPIGRKRSKR